MLVRDPRSGMESSRIAIARRVFKSSGLLANIDILVLVSFARNLLRLEVLGLVIQCSAIVTRLSTAPKPIN